LSSKETPQEGRSQVLLPQRVRRAKRSLRLLKAFVLDRSVVKKAIMTIPYNASSLSMIKYVQASLHLLEDNCSDSVA